MRMAKVKAVEYHLPAEVLSNAALAEAFGDWTAEKIFEKTGILERRVVSSHETASDLGVRAAERLLEKLGGIHHEIDFLIFCTQAPDHFLPSSACLIQHRLGLPIGCGALDINLGCSGFVYGLALAKGMIESGVRKNVLLITADTYTKFIHPNDRSVRTLFGDGAAATLIVAADEGQPCIGPFVMGTDGAGAGELIVRAGGSRLPTSPETALEESDASGNVRSANHLFMNGPAVMNFTLSSVPKAMKQLLDDASKTLDDINVVIFHQANAFMLEALRKKIKIPPEKFIIEMDTVGNTVSSTIPIAIARAKASGKVKSGDTALLLGFGVGFSWAGTIIEMF
jgi:3-oxoacyl-[acyl-carrier-protein] synthase III